jgi:hypothetical protein
MFYIPLFAPPPETTNYMIGGYIVIFSVMVVYIASLILRYRRYQQDIKILQELDDKTDDL